MNNNYRKDYVKIVELNVEERMQKEYCADITFEFYTERQSQNVIHTLRVERCKDYYECVKFAQKTMREFVKENRAKDYVKQRKVFGW